MSKLLKTMLGVAAAAVLGAGCWSAPDTGRLRVGAILPLSGDYAPAGRRMLAGIQAAVDELNARGGIADQPVELEVADMKSRPELAPELLRDLDRRRVRAVLAGYSSNDVQNLKSAANELELPVLLPAASLDELTERTPLVSRCSFSDTQQSKALAYYARFEKRFNRMGVLINLDENAVYARDIGRKTAQEFVEYGGQVVKMAGIHDSDTDFRPALKRLIEADAEVIVAPAGPVAAARLVEQARELGFRGLLLGSDTWNEPEFFKALGSSFGECVFPAQYAPEMTTPVQLRLAGLLKKEPGELTDAEVQGFDAMQILAVALASGETGTDLSEAIRRVRRFPVTVGEVTMRDDGNAERRIFLQLLESREGKPTARTVLALEGNQLNRRLRLHRLEDDEK